MVGNATISGDLTVDTDTLYVDSTNNRVGIGTSSPTQALDITTAGTTRAFIRNTNLTSSGMYIGEDGTGQQILGLGAYPMRFSTNGSEAMRIDSSGNVGIGTDSPSSPLHIDTNADGNILQMNGASTAWDLMARSSNGASPASGEVVYSLGMYRDNGASSPNGVINFGRGPSSQNGYLTFDVNGDEAMRIDASGNLLVGTTSTTNYNNNAGTTADDGLLYLDSGILSVSSHKATANAGFVQYLNRTNTDGGLLDFRKDGVSVGAIGNNAAASGLTIYSTARGGIALYANGTAPTDGSGIYSDNIQDLGANCSPLG